MNDYLQNCNALNCKVTDDQLVDGFRSAVEKSCGRVFKIAQDEWERRFGGKEPSDACVSVRISSRGPRRALPSINSGIA